MKEKSAGGAGGAGTGNFEHVTHRNSFRCEGLSAATKLNTARLINEDIMCTVDCNIMEEITEQMLN